MLLPYNLSDQSLTFFARKRPWTVPKDNANFDYIAALLQSKAASVEEFGSEDAFVDELVRLADPKVALVAASQGKLEWQGDSLVWNGQPLHGFWVDKILKFRKEGLNYEPIFLALQDLMTNPEPRAIERLPLFLEKGGLGLLPDGRFVAFKGVQQDYLSIHTGPRGKIDWSVGKVAKEPREEVNPDPDATCVRGLHVGTFDYIKNGYGWGNNRRLVLTAVWPHDVVAVPEEYGWGKIRVCEAEVIDDVDQAYADALLSGRGTTVLNGYGPSQTVATPAVNTNAEPRLYDQIKIGDFVELDDQRVLEVTDMRVAEADGDDDDDQRYITVLDYDGLTMEIEDVEVVRIANDAPVWMKVVTGQKVMVEGDNFIKDGTYVVESVDHDAGGDPDSHERILILYGHAEEGAPVANDCIKAIVKDEEEAAPQSGDAYTYTDAEVGDTVRVEGHAVLPDGWYIVSQVYDRPVANQLSQRLQVRTLNGNVWVDNETVKVVSKVSAAR